MARMFPWLVHVSVKDFRRQKLEGGPAESYVKDSKIALALSGPRLAGSNSIPWRRFAGLAGGA